MTIKLKAEMDSPNIDILSEFVSVFLKGNRFVSCVRDTCVYGRARALEDHHVLTNECSGVTLARRGPLLVSTRNCKCVQCKVVFQQRNHIADTRGNSGLHCKSTIFSPTTRSIVCTEFNRLINCL